MQLAESDADIERCFPVMVQLRPHLSREAYLAQVKRQQAEGYQLSYIEEAGAVRAVAGFRVGEMLARGKYLYVDDLVTDSAARSRGFGDQLIDELVAHARALNCDLFSLDSGVHRGDAHRFYFRKRMHISAYHFSLPLKDG